jgi:hypothetical protein
MKRLISVLFGAAFLAAPSIGKAASITPDTFSATIDVGETVTVDKIIELDPTPVSKVDVFFLADNTASMGGIIGTVMSNASAILGAIAGGDPRFTGVDVAFGVGRYYGDPSEPGVSPGPPASPPSIAYQLQQAITTSQAATQAAINSWSASGGDDFPEANFFALHQVATEGGSTDGVGSTDPGIATGQVTDWRDGAGRVIVWFGDAPSHTTTVDQAEAIAALTGASVTVAAINTESSGLGIDFFGQASAIVGATGGTLTNDVSGTTATIDAILAAVSSAISTIDLTFAAIGDTSGLNVSYTCTDALGCTGVPGGESRDFKMTVTGVSPGTYVYDTIAVGVAGASETDTITVRGTPVPEPGTLLLFATGLIGLGLIRRRSRRA